MINYSALIAVIEENDNQLLDFETNSFSRSYTGYTLFSKHFHTYVKNISLKDVDDLELITKKLSATSLENAPSVESKVSTDTDDDDDDEVEDVSVNEVQNVYFKEMVKMWNTIDHVGKKMWSN